MKTIDKLKNRIKQYDNLYLLTRNLLGLKKGVSGLLQGKKVVKNILSQHTH